MEYLPGMNHLQIKDTVKLNLDIKISPFLADHKFENKPVLPGVEALRILAHAAQPFLQEKNISIMTNAEFKSFLPLPVHENTARVFINIDFLENGAVKSSLMTQIRSGKMKIRRIKEHVSLEFPSPGNASLKQDCSPSIPGINKDCFEIPSHKIYRELVPFGPAYHNITGNLKITENRAQARVFAREFDAGEFNETCSLLGSPFPLDAAFHAACVWSQRYTGIVAFPTGFARRCILEKTKTGKTYTARVKPVQEKPPLLIFDMEIYTLKGALCEVISGVRMQDVSGGRLKPPDWIVKSGHYYTKA